MSDVRWIDQKGQPTDTAPARATLAGIRQIGILIERLSPDGIKAGLSDGLLQETVAAALREAGIAVVPMDGPYTGDGFSFLVVNVTVEQVASIRDGKIGLLLFTTALYLYQAVHLARQPGTAHTAITWHTGLTGAVPTTAASDFLWESVRRCQQKFIEAWQSVNPAG